MSKYCLVRLVGQEVKTSPSHGEISGSIPLRAVRNNTGNSVLFFCIFLVIPMILAFVHEIYQGHLSSAVSPIKVK